MDGGKNYGKCGVCGWTMSVHINVSKPPDHHFLHVASPEPITLYDMLGRPGQIGR